LVREGFAGGETVVTAGATVSVGGIGVDVAVSVGTGVRVIVGVSDAGGTSVKVGRGVFVSPDGWKGVGVEDAFGSRVTRIKVGKTGGAGAGEEQESKKVKSKK
jgi:hypothetical protein